MIESIFSSSYPERKPAKLEHKVARVEKGHPSLKVKQTTSQSWDWYEKSTQHILNMANHKTTPLSWNEFTPLDCQCFKTNLPFKQRNVLYKNEAIIRLSSHHTMQRKPEDRVFPL